MIYPGEVCGPRPRYRGIKWQSRSYVIVSGFFLLSSAKIIDRVLHHVYIGLKHKIIKTRYLLTSFFVTLNFFSFIKKPRFFHVIL